MLRIKLFNFIFVIYAILLISCSNLLESAGVTRKSIDEFQAIENPPLIIPPDFDLVAPDQIQQKNIDDVEKELAQEILFGLDEKEQNTKKQLSTMNEILSQADATDVSNDIREEINQEFALEKKTDNIFNTNLENEIEVLDAVKESERIRNKNFKGESIDQEFSREKKTDNILQIDWENEEEIFDAVKESERLRDKNFQGDEVFEDEVPIKTEEIKVKKKKRFFFF